MLNPELAEGPDGYCFMFSTVQWLSGRKGPA